MITNTDDLIDVELCEQSRLSEVDFDNLQFGHVFSDHMLIAEYRDGKWGKAKVQPYKALSMSPAASVLHYGQSIFEGMKAYKREDGSIWTFRPERNFNRMNQSAERMCMPHIPKDIFIDGLKKLISVDRNWVPKNGGSLYIRPFMIGTDEFIGVRPSNTYKFMIFTCPVSTYYSKPVNVKIETVYSRACEGGVGRAKAAGNYAAALYPAKKAQEDGYDQLIWTDAKEHKFIEESGTMNIMFVMDGKLYTPPLSGTTLAGITRDSVLTVAKDWGMEVEENNIAVDTIVSALKKGELQEAFGVGTAATVAHIKSIGYHERIYELPPVENREFSNKVAAYLQDIRMGKEEDIYRWMQPIVQ